MRLLYFTRCCGTERRFDTLAQRDAAVDEHPTCTPILGRLYLP